MLIYCIHFVLPWQAGHLELFDISSGAMTESFEAHEGAVWSICLSPDQVHTCILQAL